MSTTGFVTNDAFPSCDELPGCFALYIVRVALLPGEERTELAPSLLNGVSLALGAKRLKLGSTGILVSDEALCESSGLDVRKDTLHVLFDVWRDHARAGD